MSGATKLMTAGGGGVNIQPASSIASDVTVNVPSQNCTLGIQGPAFSAYAGTTTTLANSTWTKIAFNTEEFDTANCFDNSTNYRFTPTVSGYYSVSSVINTNQTANGLLVTVYKNGSRFKDLNLTPYIGSIGTVCGGNTLIYLNGSTDYVEIYAIQVSGTAATVAASSQNTYFQAALVRAA